MLSTSQEVLLDEETRDLPPDRLRRVLQDYETKTFFQIMGAARKERYEMDRDRVHGQAGLVKRGVSRRARVRGPPTPTSAGERVKPNRVFMGEPMATLDHIEGNSDSDWETDDSDTGDDISSTSSASIFGEKAKPPQSGQGEDPAQDRLDEVSCWLKSFDWKADSSIAGFTDHCWRLDDAKDSKIRLFPNRNALRSFLVRRSAQFGAESRYFAKVFGAGPTGQKEKQYHHSTQSHPNTQERIDRVLRYAGLYKGWKSTVKVDFYRWVYAQDIKAAKSGVITQVDAFSNLMNVVNFMAHHGPFKPDMRKTGRWDQCPPLKEMFDTWAQPR